MRKRTERVSAEVLLLPGASNLSDFDPLLRDEDIDLRFIESNDEMGSPDLFILPGTKNSILDMQYITRNGCANKIRHLSKAGSVILGICGGFQMLGAKIIDIKGSESRLSKCEGIGFLNIVTRLMPSRVDSTVKFEPINNKIAKSIDIPLKGFSGFETHTGRTKYLNGSRPLFRITSRDEKEVEIYDGAVNEERNVFGTYIHRIFDNDVFRKGFIRAVLDIRAN